MQKLIMEENDIISPDRLRIDRMGIDIGCGDVHSAMPLSYDGSCVYYSAQGNHMRLHDVAGSHTFDLRYFFGCSLMSFWSYSGETGESVKGFVSAVSNGRVRCVDETFTALPFSTEGLKFVFTSTDGALTYIVICGCDEIHGDGIMANEDLRAYHLASPVMKKSLVPGLSGWRRAYFKESERAWTRKHGDIDPAYYHLLMYGE